MLVLETVGNVISWRTLPPLPSTFPVTCFYVILIVLFDFIPILRMMAEFC